MNQILEEIVTTKKIFIDITTLMCGQKDFFILDLYGLLEKNGKRVYVISTLKSQLEKEQSFAEKKNNAQAALEVLEKYEKLGVVEYLKSDDLANEIDSSGEDCCLFTEDKELVRTFSKTIKKDVYYCKIGEGKIVHWIVSAPMVASASKAKNPTDPKLFINIILDNSASMKGSKINSIKHGLSMFMERLKNDNSESRIEYSIVAFSGFDALQFKAFNQPLNIDNLYAGGIPFVGVAMEKGIGFLSKRLEQASENGEKYYKPWTILLLNGENYGDITQPATKLVNLIKSGAFSYFPFALSTNEFNPNLSLMKKIKSFTVIKDEMYDNLFMWIYNLAYQRINTPLEKSFSIDPKSFEGWTIK